MANNKYWDGTIQANLRGDQVHTEWARKAGGGNRVKILNVAFRIFYNARQQIKNLPLASRSAATRDLEFCANKGWGFGVHSLAEAFDHMSRGNGEWSDENQTYRGTQPYYCCPDWFVQIYVPNAADNFLKHIDVKLKEAKKSADAMLDAAKALPDAIEKSGDWKRVHDILDTIKETAEWSNRLLLFKLPMDEVAEKLGESAEHIATGIAEGVKALGKIATAIETYDRATAAGMSRPAGAALGALQALMEEVPVFGEAYAAVIGGIPYTAQFLQERHDQVMIAIEAASR